MNCVFCNTPSIKERTVIENELAFVFPTNIPIVPGHILVAPKRCVPRYGELTPAEKEAIDELREILVAKLANVLGAQGFNYAWNENAVAGQSVMHFHLHVLPRKEGDAEMYGFEPREFLYRPKKDRRTHSEEELKSLSEKIKNAL